MPLGMVSFPTTTTVHSITLYVSAIAGYVGISFLLWLYILGARGVARFLSDDFGYLLKIHDWLGKYGTLLIFLHPIFITISYGESWLYSFMPSISNEYEFYVMLGRAAFYILIVIWLASAILRSKLKYRPWKYIHFISYLILPLALIHIPQTGSSYATDVITRLYFWIIVIGFIIFTLTRLRSALGLDKQKYQIIEHMRINDRVYQIQLKPLQNSSWIAPKPGQYIYIRNGLFSEEHPFSVLYYQPSNGIMTIAYKVYGRFTKRLANTVIGKKITISGPFGDFTSDISSKPVVYIAGGIGVTPFVSRIVNESDQREQWLFYANHSPKDSILLNELSKSLGNKLINLYSVIDGVTVDHNQRGQVFNHKLISSINNPGAYNYYMCGPDPLMDIMQAELYALGVSKSSIHRESFGF